MGNKAIMLGVFLACANTAGLRVSIICLEMLVTRKVCYFVLIFVQFVKSADMGYQYNFSLNLSLRADNVDGLSVQIRLLRASSVRWICNTFIYVFKIRNDNVL